MPPIFSGSTGLHVFLVEHQVLEVRGGVEFDYEGVGVGADGGVLPLMVSILIDHFRCRQYPIFVTILLTCWILPNIPTPLRIVSFVNIQFFATFMYVKLLTKMPLQVGHRYSSRRFKFTRAGWALGIVIPWTSRRGRLWRLLKSFYKIATCLDFLNI